MARTDLGHPTRLIIAGHTDTVPINDNGTPKIDGDTLWGCGASDMKSGLAVMLELARTVPEPSVDVTYVFYEAEEIDAVHNGLARLFRERPDLLEGDVLCSVNRPTAPSKRGVRAPCVPRSSSPEHAPTPRGRGWGATRSSASHLC